MIEGEFAVNCTQCGGEEFREVFPVPAERYMVYEGQERREVVAAAYACVQCGHLEKFVDLEGDNEKEPPP